MTRLVISNVFKTVYCLSLYYSLMNMNLLHLCPFLVCSDQFVFPGYRPHIHNSVVILLQIGKLPLVVLYVTGHLHV